MNAFESISLRKDFDFFLRNIVKLTPTEFCGLAKILSTPMIDQEKVEIFKKEDFKDVDLEIKRERIQELVLPMDKVLEKMMDRFLELPKRRRKEINQILINIQRGK